MRYKMARLLLRIWLIANREKPYAALADLSASWMDEKYWRKDFNDRQQDKTPGKAPAP
jgi:hypothetical protein